MEEPISPKGNKSISRTTTSDTITPLNTLPPSPPVLSQQSSSFDLKLPNIKPKKAIDKFVAMLGAI